MIWGSKPMSSIRSASSSTWPRRELVKHTHTRTLNGWNGAHQVGDGAQVDKLVHLQVVEAAGSGDDYVHSAGHQLDLSPAVPTSIDTNTSPQKGGRNGRHEIKNTHCSLDVCAFICVTNCVGE